MVVSSFISRKLKFSEKPAAIAIAVSFFVIIVAVAVSSGFRQKVEEGIVDLAGDIRISPFQDSSGEAVSMPRHLGAENEILNLPGVKEIVPVVTRGGIVKNGDILQGVIVKGVPMEEAQPLEVSIPSELENILGLSAGEDMTVWFPGEKLRARKFKIARVREEGFQEGENIVVKARLEDMQRLCGWGEDEVSSLEIILHDAFRRGPVREDIAARTGYILRDESLLVQSSDKAWPQVFDWLTLVDFNVGIILILMAVVAGFNMISGLLIMLLRNISMIGTLKTLGMTSGGIGKVFVKAGSRAVLRGLLTGNALALAFCFIQDSTRLIPLDPENYFVSYVPVHVDIVAVILANAAALLLILGLLWIPTLFVSSIDPATTVKAD